LDFNAKRRRSPLILELTPLIDVVFLLLLFFMVSTTFVQEPAALEVDLPQSNSTALVPAGSDTEILLGADGRVVIGGKVTDIAALKEELRRIAQEDPNTQVVVRGDKTVAYQQLIDIMSLAQEEGLTQFSLATSRPVGGGGAPPSSAP
jgi:biopolymer transport protein ExbD